MSYRIGIDAGSKTIKIVILTEEGSLLHSVYRRHRASIRETLRDLLHEIVWRRGDLEGDIAITGSAGIELARILNLPFVQEVIATTHAVQTKIPEADAVIELGGEDAKVIYLTDGLEQRMNATCAGGTGGFIDTMAYLLGVRTQRISDLALRAGRLYPIASRCAVFAQTDVRPFLNAGAKKADIAASVLEAVVKQTLGGLAAGRPIKGTVVFLGGPLEYIPHLVHRFRSALDLTTKTGIKPRDAHLFTAEGAALLAPSLNNDATLNEKDVEPPLSLTHLEDTLNRQIESSTIESLDELSRLEPLFTSVKDYEEFKRRHENVKIGRKRFFDVEGPVYLGIDSGSTTVKMVAIDENAQIVYSDYQPVGGDALETATKMLADFYSKAPKGFYGDPTMYVAHATVTGYGEALLKTAFNADSGVVETIAHLSSAKRLCKDVSFVLDIGGQDIKALWVRDGVVENTILNEACSSGCGSFIEGTARSLRKTPYSFSDSALYAPRPIDLGVKCTVFMTSRVRHAQKIGASYEDIAAGLCYSVVKNALFKTIGMKNLDEMGDTIIVQGGAFMSDAVLRAFELVSGKKVMRPNLAHLMGAYGAALTALSRSSVEARSTLIELEELDRLDPHRINQTCSGCSNSCDLTIVAFKNGHDSIEEQPRIVISGNRCSRAYDDFVGKLSFEPEKQIERPPNMYRLEQRLLSRYHGSQTELAPTLSRHLTRVGIPHALHLYESLAFWHTLLSRLGFTVVVAQNADDSIDTTVWQKRTALTEGLETVPSESVCYPAKSIHLQVAELISEGVDAIFFPEFERGTRCPVSSLYARVLKDSVPALREGRVRLVSPSLQALRPSSLAVNQSDSEALFNSLRELCPADSLFSKTVFENALKIALDEQSRFEQSLQLAADNALSWLELRERNGIVLAGRPYHVDKRLSHGIDTMLEDLGFAVFSPLSLEHLITKTKKSASLKGASPPSWRAAKSWTQLAAFVIDNPRLNMVSLYSFGCSYDAINLNAVKSTLEVGGALHTALKIDEMVDLSHIRIRLRTLNETLMSSHERSEKKGANAEAPLEKVNGLAKQEGDDKQIQNYLAKQAPEEGKASLNDGFSSDKTPVINTSKELLCLPPIAQRDIDCARKYVNHEVCFVAQAMTGSLINAAFENKEVRRFEIPDVCEDCLLRALPDLVSQAVGRRIEIDFVRDWKGELPLISHQRNIEKENHSNKIGILGDSLMCYDAFMNNDISSLISSFGFTPVFPQSDLLFRDDVRYLEQLDAFEEEGINHVIYCQAFGCLKGHIQTRGALRGLQQRYPNLYLTVIDYDPDTSTLNQENRILLALTAAKQALEMDSSA